MQVSMAHGWVTATKTENMLTWILGGDRNPENDTALKIWRSMAAGIIEGTGKGTALITYHPQPNEQGSGQYFYNDEWFSFNMLQKQAIAEIHRCMIKYIRHG